MSDSKYLGQPVYMTRPAPLEEDPEEQVVNVHTVMDGDGNPIQVTEENVTTGAKTTTNFTYEVEQ